MADVVLGEADPQERDEKADPVAAPEEASRKVEPQQFNSVLQEELQTVVGAVEVETKAVGAASGKPKASKEIGLSLSGGGIRSAAFSLGVVQALHVHGLFPKIDFLSTVSGGGYTGAALVAGLKRLQGKFPFGMDDTTDRLGMGANEIGDNDVVQALRDKSRYLMPAGKFDLIVSLAIILRGLAVNAVMVASAIFLAAAVTLFFNPKKDMLEDSWVYSAIGSASENEKYRKRLGKPT